MVQHTHLTQCRIWCQPRPAAIICPRPLTYARQRR